MKRLFTTSFIYCLPSGVDQTIAQQDSHIQHSYPLDLDLVCAGIKEGLSVNNLSKENQWFVMKDNSITYTNTAHYPTDEKTSLGLFMSGGILGQLKEAKQMTQMINLRERTSM